MGNKALLAAALFAAGTSPALAATGFDWGGDFRFRVTELNYVPTNAAGGAFNFYQLFNRNRTRVWLQYKPNEDTTLRLRMLNEFRFYDEGRNVDTKWDAMNEFVPDEIYADFRNLADGKMDLRIGRQALVYGTGKILLDPSPLDGSRSNFMDGVKATLKFDKHSLDLFAVYSFHKDPLTINRQDRVALVEQDETGVGLYGKYNRFEQAPFEYYWVYKTEDNSLVDVRTGEHADAEFHTVGARVMPKFGSGWSANLEGAFQSGDHGSKDVDGRLLDASLTFSPEIWGSVKPAFTAGYYYLSGDDTDGSAQGWHPVFSRWPQISELYLYSWVGTQYSVGGWSNLETPYIGMDLTPFGKTRLQLRYYKLSADTIDGPGGGDDRGDLFTANLKFQLLDNLSGHLRGEWLNVGDYYAPGTKDGRFLRFELFYKF